MKSPDKALRDLCKDIEPICFEIDSICDDDYSDAANPESREIRRLVNKLRTRCRNALKSL